MSYHNGGVAKCDVCGKHDPTPQPRRRAVRGPA